MSWQPEPEFLTREIVDAIHEERIEAYGGLHGVRDENGLESQLPRRGTFTTTAVGDVYEVAAAYDALPIGFQDMPPEPDGLAPSRQTSQGLTRCHAPVTGPTELLLAEAVWTNPEFVPIAANTER